MSSRPPPIRYLILAAVTTVLVLLFTLTSPARNLRSQLSVVSTTMADTWYKGITLADNSKTQGSLQTSTGPATSVSGIGGVDNALRRANATFVILCRNSDLWETIASIRQLEDRFNHQYNYPYTFLNDEPFSEEFILHTTSIVSGKTEYGVTGAGEWGMPDWVDRKVAEEKMREMGKLNIPYAGSENYRKMCRYQVRLFLSSLSGTQSFRVSYFWDRQASSGDIHRWRSMNIIGEWSESILLTHAGILLILWIYLDQV